MTPTIIFKNHQQARQCLRYWQSILSLSDWIISIHLTNDSVIAPNWGSSKIYRAMHIAEISIPAPYEGQMNYFPQKYVQELILVHELCHVRLSGYRADPYTHEGDFYDAEQHASLEAIAKGLIMARYNVGREWFWNF